MPQGIVHCDLLYYQVKSKSVSTMQVEVSHGKNLDTKILHTVLVGFSKSATNIKETVKHTYKMGVWSL
jgi:hypothetical protein